MELDLNKSQCSESVVDRPGQSVANHRCAERRLQVNNGHVEGEAAQVNEAETDNAFKGNAQPGTDRHEPRTPESPVNRCVAREEEEEQTPDSFPQHIKSIISSLRVVVDQIDSDFKQARELILEIAKRLDEGQLCERSQISRILKKNLRDKIQEGKVTEKWIEECLPPEYKRTYVKSELSSLSKQKKPQLVEVRYRRKTYSIGRRKWCQSAH